MQTPISLNITSNTPPINRIMTYQDIAKLEKFSGEEDNTYSWIADAEKAITANGWNNDHTVQALPFFLTKTADSWYQSLAEKPTSFTEFKLTFLQYFFIERDYYTTAQVLNQFIKELRSSILRSIRPCHLTSLQDAVTFIHNFKSAEQEANHTQAVNLAINGTSDPELQELTNHPNGEKITTTADTHSNRTVSNSNNLGDPIPATATTEDHGSKSRKPISATQILAKHGTPIFHTSESTAPIRTTSPNFNNNQVQTNSGLSRPIPCGPVQSQPTPTEYSNQASYFGLMEDQSFDKSTPQTKNNIPPVTITEDTTLAIIFPCNINNLNTHSLFSGTAINQDKPIMGLYTNARVGGIDIKLILNNRSAGSIITKQLMDQLSRQVDHAATAQIITVDGNTKTLIGEIDNFPFEINGIQIPTKVLPTLLSTGTPKNFNSLDDYRTELPPPPTWEEKGKGRAEEETQLSSLGYITLDQRNLFYQLPRLICINCGKKLSTMGACIGDNKKWPTATKYYYRPLGPYTMSCIRGGTCDKACQYTILINDWDNPWTPKYTGPDYSENNFFTDNPDTFQNQYQELVPTRKEQKQRLANLNIKLCDYCLIPCHFQYCDKCDLMFNPPPKILFSITELSEPKKEVLIIEDISFQDPTEDTKTEQYLTYPNLSKELELKWYSNNKEKICPERAHDTDAGFDLQYPEQSSIIIAPHSLIKIDLKIVLEIPVSTMVQVVSQSSLAKKKIDIKKELSMPVTRETSS
ncbi:hypothetical protein G9A89_022581 [Geosiphon pyriformis]|nr:hypothetical protein G9A89_022581 [Geosiphon pyriformis]